MEEKRVADYFVVAGLPANPRPLEEDCVAMQPSGASFGSMPVTDIAVIVRTEGETPPPGFECIEQTPLGFPADLNHGSLRSPSIYLCYRRGRDKPPLVDIGVLYENKQRVMADSEILKKTPYGRPANVNNSGSRTFLTFRRASENAPCNQLVVTDLCIILANKGETPPHAYCKIDRNLNKGMVGSDVFLCYKKSMNRPSLICYEPAVLERFPREDYASFPLPEQVALFCLPMGATVEAWPKKASQPRPTFSTFVLTLGSADKVYGASITFYERFPEEQLTDAQRAQLSSSNRSGQPQPTEEEVFSANKSICLLSHWPFFRTFEKFLRFLYRLSFVKNPRVSVERYISHFMLDIPFPSVQRPRIWIQLEDDHISLSQLEDTPLPLSGASFKEFLKTLAPDNCLCVLLLALTEQKMLFHSLRPDVLTSVSEALVALMFPFHWQCPYIPLCPLGLSDVLSAPLPFIVGVDSRYFDMYEPPQEVACIDLDTNTIFINEEKSFLTLKLLPKKATKTLRGNLQSLYEKVCLYENNVASIAAAAAQNTSAGGALGPIDREIGLHRKERRLELDIQEAFLRFMAAILKDFGSYLRPITTAPKPGVTDPNSLFDINGFLKSRDRTYHRFYQLMMHTQMFTRFIEERSFVSDKDVSLAFFDECTERVDAAGESAEHLLLEVAGSMQSHEHTVFISAPEPPLVEGLNGSPGVFGALNPALFHRQPAMSLLRVVPEFQPSASPVARRTKQEVKSALRAARIQAECPVSWAKCLAATSYSVWFMHLPAYTKTFASKAKALRVADEVLQRMQQLKLPAPDEVSYRILMLLCGQYGQPALAVKILFDMKKHGIQANAITYGYYNKAVLECAWPTGDSAHWAKLRNVVLAVSQFKRALRRSQGSLGCTVPDAPRSAGSSRTSLEETLRPQLDPMAVTPELLPELLTKTDDRSSSDAVAKPRVHTAAGDQSDAGYGSTSQDETAKASWQELPVVPQPSRERIAPQQRQRRSGAVVQSMRFEELDFTESDRFRNRVNSLIRGSVGALGSASSLTDAIVPSAGVLITSEAMRQNAFLRSNDGVMAERLQSGRRRYHSASDRANQRRPNNIRRNLRVLGRSWTLGGEDTALGQGDSHLAALAETPVTPEAPSESPLVKEQQEEDYSAGPTPHVSSSRPSDVVTPPRSMPRPAPVHRFSTGGSPANLARTLEQSKEFINSTLSPLRDAWQQIDLSGAAASISSTLGLKTRKFSLGSKMASVTRSSTFHSNHKSSSARSSPARSSSQMESLVEQDAPPASPSPTPTMPLESTVVVDGPAVSNPRGLSRSSTLPYSPGRRYSPQCLPSSREAPPLASGQSPQSSTFGLSRLSSRHSEYLVDSLRLAANSMASKFTEIKQSLSASNTPTRGSSYSLPRGYEHLLLEDDDQESSLSLESSRRASMDLLMGHGGEENFEELAPEDSLLMTDTAIGGTLGAGSSLLRPMEPTEAVVPTVTGGSTSRVALEVSITSCSQCNTCRSLLYDEEIMDGWTADDSNLNTRCYFCNGTVVPLLTVSIKDYRVEDSPVGGSLAPSMESLPSATGLSSRLSPERSPLAKELSPEATTGRAVTPDTRAGDFHASRPDSIDSGNDGFLLLEESPDADGPRVGDSCPESPLGSPPGQAGTSYLASPTSRALSAPVDIPLAAANESLMVASPSSGSNETSDRAEHRTRRVTVGDAPLGLRTAVGRLGSAELLLDPQSAAGTTPLFKLGSASPSRVSLSLGPSVSLDPMTVPYLSPLVLRKEVENLLEHEGDDCLLSAGFVDHHPILYWNLIWYFKRLSLPSHLPELCLQAVSLLRDRQVPEQWQSVEGKMVVISCCWDNPRLHNNMVPYMYSQLGKNNMSSLVQSLVTEDNKPTKSLRERVLSCVQQSNVREAVELLVRERHKTRNQQRRPSLYRDVLFLSLVAIGKDALNQNLFYRDYVKIYEELAAKRSALFKCDKYPSVRAMLCRKYFRDLELKPFSFT
ncbi:C-myc promoter-binding protein isoform X2 [Dermacentor andersoni]|uniref:C-myc promoter-binding protein isoform X2 n=1 Tax=Dermacentor andersoni TaxID=34620 RepID=UPI002155BC0B|nr:DENN domain-containing protein Crag-like isoform X2 [Dermacentor andersoni]